jgi:hypothetical protein
VQDGGKGDWVKVGSAHTCRGKEVGSEGLKKGLGWNREIYIREFWHEGKNCKWCAVIIINEKIIE